MQNIPLDNHIGIDAMFYDSHSGLFQKDLEYYKKFIKDKNINNALEIGVGTGRLIVPLAKSFNKTLFYGLDCSEDMLSICSQKTKGISNISLHNNKMIDFQFDIKFDLIYVPYSTFMYNYTIENQLSSLKNFKKALTNNGTILISVQSYDLDKIKKRNKNKREINFIHNNTNYKKRFYEVHDFKNRVSTIYLDYYQDLNKINTSSFVQIMKFFSYDEFIQLSKLSNIKIMSCDRNYEFNCRNDEGDLTFVLHQ